MIKALYLYSIPGDSFNLIFHLLSLRCVCVAVFLLSHKREFSQVKRGKKRKNSSCDNSFHGLPGCYSSLCKGIPGGREVILFAHILWKQHMHKNII